MATKHQQQQARRRRVPAGCEEAAPATDTAEGGGHVRNHSRPFTNVRHVSPSSSFSSRFPFALLLLLAVLGASPLLTQAFKYQIKDKYAETAKWSFTETYMYGSGKGPLAWRNGDASVSVDLDLGVSTYNAEDFLNVSVLFYHATNPELFVPEGDLCALEFPEEASDVQLNTFAATKAEGEDNLWKVKVQADYPVSTSGVQNVLFQLCPTLVSAREIELQGEIGFENPYGYLPGRFFGYLPFEGARFFAFLFFDLAFLVAFVKNRRDLLRLHWAILLVLVVATLEALAWFLAFDVMNNSGVPYCCPFPPVVIFAMVCELFQKTFSRALLLTICLGYGIARPKLHKGEWMALLTLTLLYLGASMLDEASEISEATQIKNNEGSAAALAAGRVWWSFPALICDIIFLSWIYMSLVTMMKILREQNETYKLQMYHKLSSTILVFVTLFGALTVVVLLARVGFIQWPWNLLWAETVSWEVLNFAVLAAICWIWRPSPTSKFLAQAKQLPTSEAGAHHGEEGIEFSISSQFSIADDDDEDLNEDLDDDLGHQLGMGGSTVAHLR